MSVSTKCACATKLCRAVRLGKSAHAAGAELADVACIWTRG